MAILLNNAELRIDNVKFVMIYRGTVICCLRALEMSYVICVSGSGAFKSFANVHCTV